MTSPHIGPRLSVERLDEVLLGFISERRELYNIAAANNCPISASVADGQERTADALLDCTVLKERLLAAFS